jgi:formylmethanofuran--tetrahydromethanopterin N-formyltransferase
LRINGVEVDDTFAEAFPMTAARLIITAETAAWARTAAAEATGYAASVIGCDAEAGLEAKLPPADTPDRRPGVAVLLFAFSRDALQKAAVNRIGQCVLTCATTACYNGLPLVPDKNIKIGGNLRFFGDGWQSSKRLSGVRGLESGVRSPAQTPGSRLQTSDSHARFWRIPVMDGEFLCEDVFGTTKGVAGGNFLILGESQSAALSAAEAAVTAMRQVPGVILPFPGGIVRSGSKVGSRYKKLRASTNDAYCPTLRGVVKTALPEGVNAVYEIVIDGLTLEAVEAATRVGIQAACRPGVLRISAGNYGGTLWPFHIRLHKVLQVN